MAVPGIYQQHNIILYRDGAAKSTQTSIVVEKTLKVYLDETQIAALTCSPGYWTELGIGYLFSQGLIQDPGQIKSIRCDEAEDSVWVETFARKPSRINNTSAPNPKALLNDENRFHVQDLLEWIAELDRQSASFHLTGGVHSAALAGNGYGLLVRYEDIGRHNAVDRALGHMFLNGLTPDYKCLVLSGRIASEIFIKAARAGLPLILSRSAPTMYTVQLAEQLGITVVGFARGSQLTVYSHGERILFQ
jgi:FdhD protein